MMQEAGFSKDEMKEKREGGDERNSERNSRKDKKER